MFSIPLTTRLIAMVAEEIRSVSLSLVLANMSCLCPISSFKLLDISVGSSVICSSVFQETFM